jgi:RimJ/RimL family protein N-acetyltransferase
MSTDLPIDTSRLKLRKFHKSDLDELAEFHLKPEVQRYMEWKTRDRGELEAALHTMCQQTRLNRPGDTLAIAVERKEDKRLIGHILLKWTDATASQAEMRFAFDSYHSKAADALEAMRAVLDLAFDELNLHRVFVRCAARSQPSARLLKSLGMRLEAHYREHALYQGEWDEELHFAILDREWGRGTKVKELTRHMVA